MRLANKHQLKKGQNRRSPNRNGLEGRKGLFVFRKARNVKTIFGNDDIYGAMNNTLQIPIFLVIKEDNDSKQEL